MPTFREAAEDDWLAIEALLVRRALPEASRADGPAELQASAGFKAACPASATSMTMTMSPAP